MIAQQIAQLEAMLRRGCYLPEAREHARMLLSILRRRAAEGAA